MFLPRKETPSQLLRTIASLSRIALKNEIRDRLERETSNLKSPFKMRQRPFEESENPSALAFEHTLSMRDTIITNLRRSIRELNEKNQKIIKQMEVEQGMLKLIEKNKQQLLEIETLNTELAAAREFMQSNVNPDKLDP